MLEFFYPTGIKKRLAHPQEKYTFKPGVNLLVGANGAGKSSLLYAMKPSNNKKGEYGEFDLVEGSGQVSCLFYDFEKENPRTTTMETMMVQDRYNFSNMVARFDSQFMSHGECQKITLRSIFRDVGKSVLFLDEPEAALDHGGLQLLKTLLQEASAPQVVIATHSPYLILDPRYHVIELTPGHCAQVREALSALLLPPQ
jgi:predicted ATPase